MRLSMFLALHDAEVTWHTPSGDRTYDVCPTDYLDLVGTVVGGVWTSEERDGQTISARII